MPDKILYETMKCDVYILRLWRKKIKKKKKTAFFIYTLIQVLM